MTRIWRVLNAPVRVRRFTLRELFLLTLIAAMGLAWWAEHSKVTSLRWQLGGVTEERDRLLHAIQAWPGDD